MLLDCARCASISSVLSTASTKSKSSISKASLPASILEKSRMSLMTVSSVSALARIVSANSRCSASRLVSSSRLVMPITPFIGVRISWLIFARNSLFARAADSAASFAALSASSPRTRSVTSQYMPCTPSTRSSRSMTGTLMIWIQRCSPFGLSCGSTASNAWRVSMTRCVSPQTFFAISGGERSKSVDPSNAESGFPQRSQ